MSKWTFLPIKLSDIHAVRLKNACGSTHPWWKGTCGLSCNPKGKFCSYLIRIFSFHGLPSWWYLLYCSKSLVFIFLFLLSCYKILYKKRKKKEPEYTIVLKIMLLGACDRVLRLISMWMKCCLMSSLSVCWSYIVTCKELLHFFQI